MSTKKAFRPKGVSAFRNAGGEQRAKKDYPLDRLVELERIDAHAGVLYAKQYGTNERLVVSISEEGSRVVTKKDNKNDGKKSQKNWHGNKIDALMAEDLEPGAILVLTNCRGVTTKAVGKETYIEVKCRWIEHMADLTFDKVFPGIITIQVSRDNVVRSAQVWEDKMYSLEDDDAMGNLMDRFDAVEKAYEEGEYPVRLGYQLRALREVEPSKPGAGGRPDRPPTYEPIEASYPIDWFSSQEEKEQYTGEGEYRGRPLNSKDVEEAIQAYMAFLWGVEGSEEEEDQPKYPEEVLESLKIQVAVYRNFAGGDVEFNPALAIPDLITTSTGETFALPLYQLANTKTRFTEDDEYVSGFKNFAVRGILRLVGDVYDKKEGKLKKYNMVRKIYANGLRANVLGMSTAADGGFVRVPDYLNAPREDLNADENVAPQSSVPVDEDLGGSDDGGFAADVGDAPDPFQAHDNTSSASSAKSEPEKAATEKPRKFQR